MKKNIVSVLTIIATLVSCFLPSAYAEEETVRLCAVSNNNDSSFFVDLLIRDDVAYISTEDIREATGFNVSSNGNTISISSKAKTVELSRWYDSDGRQWLPLEDTMQILGVRVGLSWKCLCFYAVNSSYEQLLSVCDKCFNQYRISTCDDADGSIGTALAIIYDVFTQGKFIAAFKGTFMKDKFTEVYSMLLTDESGENVLTDVIGLDNVLSKISKGYEQLGTTGENAGGGTEAISDVMTDCLGMSGVEPSELTLMLYNKITDPVGTFTSIKGLDLHSQLSIYKYMISIGNTCDFYSNMLRYTLFSGKLSNVYGWGREDMIDAAKEVYDYYNSDSYQEIVEEYLRKEAENIVSSTTKSLFNQSMKSYLNTAVLGLERILIDSITDILGLGTLSAKFENLEYTYCLEEIQTMAQQLYRVYSTDEASAINAKYAALLYLRCAEIWGEKWDGVDEMHTKQFAENAREYISRIASVPDCDLTQSVENAQIDVSKLKAATVADDNTSCFLNGKYVSGSYYDAGCYEDEIIIRNYNGTSFDFDWSEYRMFGVTAHVTIDNGVGYFSDTIDGPEAKIEGRIWMDNDELILKVDKFSYSNWENYVIREYRFLRIY